MDIKSKERVHLIEQRRFARENTEFFDVQIMIVDRNSDVFPIKRSQYFADQFAGNEKCSMRVGNADFWSHFTNFPSWNHSSISNF